MEYTYEYPRPSVTVDGLIFRLSESRLEILFIQRKKEPFKDQWALPGGFMEIDESPEVGVVREVQEETGLKLSAVMQLGAYGAVHRDPRGRTVSIAYISFVKDTEEAKAADDAAAVKWVDVNTIKQENLAFDHALILQNALALLKGQPIQEKLAYELKLNDEVIAQLMDHLKKIN